MLWQTAFDLALASFKKSINEYWAKQLAYDYAEYMCNGIERKRGIMIFGPIYSYKAF